MKKNYEKVKCPKCGTVIDVHEMLYLRLREEFNKKNLHLKKNQKEVEQMKLQIQESIDKEVVNRLKAERSKLEQIVKTKVEAESKYQLREVIAKEKLKLQKDVEIKSQMKIAEREHVINQLRKQLMIAQRQINQSSMQVQGEVQELKIEEELKKHFMSDQIEEVKKGTNGADVIMMIKNDKLQSCGSIAIESKRTKIFSPSWIEKALEDQRLHKSDMIIIVSEALPKNVSQFTRIDGVWICTFQELMPLAFVLRESILRIYEARSGMENMPSKLAKLHTYISSPEFANQISFIVQGFSRLKNDLDVERRSMTKIWKQREHHIETMAQTTVEIYGSIKGIAGNSVKKIAGLDLPLLGDETA